MDEERGYLDEKSGIRSYVIDEVPQERTAEEMRAYLDHPPDYDKVIFHAEVKDWPATDQARMTEEAKRAYIEEHMQTCAWCGKTREWHSLNPVRDHAFDPERKLQYIRRDDELVLEDVTEE